MSPSKMVAGILLASAPAALATPIVYGNFSGNNVNFFNVTEDSPTESGAVFGAPTVIGDALYWFPTAFSSFSTNGSSDTTTGIMTMRIVADPGQFLSEVRISEIGDYALIGIGTPATYASISGGLSVFSPSNSTTYNAPLVVTPKATYELPTDRTGAWTAVTNLDFTGLGLSVVDLTFTATLATGSEAGTSAYVQRKVIGGPVLKVEVPAPGALGLAVAAGAVAMRRRRR